MEEQLRTDDQCRAKKKYRSGRTRKTEHREDLAVEARWNGVKTH